MIKKNSTDLCEGPASNNEWIGCLLKGIISKKMKV